MTLKIAAVLGKITYISFSSPRSQRFFALKNQRATLKMQQKKSKNDFKNRRCFKENYLYELFRGQAVASPRSQRFFALKNQKETLKMH